MSFEMIQPYIVPALLVAFIGWRYIRGRQVRAKLPELLKAGAIVVDVRTPQEFSMGSNPNSLNIPLDQMKSGIKKLDPNKTIILCCASGSRSGVAAGILRASGFKNVINAGSWTNTLTDK